MFFSISKVATPTSEPILLAKFAIPEVKGPHEAINNIYIIHLDIVSHHSSLICILPRVTLKPDQIRPIRPTIIPSLVPIFRK